MSAPAPAGTAIKAWLELVQSYGPGMAGWVIAIGVLMLCAWVFGRMATAHARHTKSVLEMSEDLRKTLKLEKEQEVELRKRCEAECRAKDRLIAQLKRDSLELAKQHTFARNQFLEEAREREATNRRLAEQVEGLFSRLQAMELELESHRRKPKRSTDP